MAVSLRRADVLGFRARAQQLDRRSGDLAGTAVLDIGVQDTGPDGGRWALALRGVDPAEATERELVALWTIRGAPHLYRRADLAEIAAAVEPFSEADAGKRIFDAVKPLRAAGIGAVAALDAVAAAMRSVVTAPTAKGAVSEQVAALMSKPYLRFCRSCDATHLYEMPFRLAAVRAGLELEPGTSPPVLRRIDGFTRADAVPDRFQLIRCYLRLLGPATPRDVAGYLDAPVREVKDRWPADAVEVSVEGGTAWALDADAERLLAGPAAVTRLLGPFDLFLQARDREMITDDPARAKTLWPVLGRPGGVLHDGEIVGTWRARKKGTRLELRVEPWAPVTAGLRGAIADEAERLATYRDLTLAGIEVS